MKIDAHTKVSEIIKASSQAIDVLVSVSAKFRKLQNPLLRKIMAPRVNLEQAAKIGGVRTEDIFHALRPLGFDFDSSLEVREFSKKKSDNFSLPDSSEVIYIDVRPVLASGGDPLKNILSNLKNLDKAQVLCVINSFEPIPLITLLKRKGYECYVKYVDADEVHTFIPSSKPLSTYSETAQPDDVVLPQEAVFDNLLIKYSGYIIEVDVRNLEMPLPMLRILELLEDLPENKVLYVHHKKVPVYLLPELDTRGFEYFIKVIGEGDVKLIIRPKQ